MLKITKFKLTKAALSALPDAERSLLLLLGHASNEINILQKLILMSRPPHGAKEEVGIAQSGQSLILIRLLAGKLHEAWLLFSKRVLADALMRDRFVDGLDEGRPAHEELRKHFGQNNVLTEVRNKLAFHSQDKSELIIKHFNELPESENWDFYLAESMANTFYHASELVMTSASLGFVKDKTDVKERFEILLDTVIRVSGYIGVLFMDIIAQIAAPLDVACEEFEISDAVKQSEFSLPFFLDEDDLRAWRDDLKRGASQSA